MAIRQSLSSSTKREHRFLSRALAAAVAAQKTNIKSIEEFGDSEAELRGEYAYLAWLEKTLREDGELSLVRG